MRSATQNSYSERIDRVVKHIAAHLDDRLSLEDLSSVAALSPYHFHRIYSVVMGETAGQSVRRLRLHRAAAELIQSDREIAAIAKRAGYGSAEAFTRAFSTDYGIPPAAYRAARSLSDPVKPGFPMEQTLYQVQIKTFPGAHLAAIAHRGDYNKIGVAFDQLGAWAGPRGLFGPQTQMFGVYLDDPASVPEKELRSFAGLTMPLATELPAHVIPYTIPACAVASVVHKGPYAELLQAYQHLYRVWLPESGREPADQPCFEEYLNSPRDLPPTEWLTEVSMPLQV